MNSKERIQYEDPSWFISKISFALYTKSPQNGSRGNKGEAWYIQSLITWTPSSFWYASVVRYLESLLKERLHLTWCDPLSELQLSQNWLGLGFTFYLGGEKCYHKSLSRIINMSVYRMHSCIVLNTEIPRYCANRNTSMMPINTLLIVEHTN